MLVIEDLDGATIERAGVLMASEHAAARQLQPGLPAAFDSAGTCAAGLRRLCDSGHHGLIASDRGRTVAVLAVSVCEGRAGRYALLPPEGFAVEPGLADPTGVLAAPLIADGVRRYCLLHAALPRLSEAVSNLGFGRRPAYGVQPAAPRRGSSAVTVWLAGDGIWRPSRAWRFGLADLAPVRDRTDSPRGRDHAQCQVTGSCRRPPGSK
jgi:hypothetical protein